jgi:hypothetical protein
LLYEIHLNYTIKNKGAQMGLKPREKTKQLSTWRCPESLYNRIQSIMAATKANYTDVMHNLLSRGLDDYERNDDRD